MKHKAMNRPDARASGQCVSPITKDKSRRRAHRTCMCCGKAFFKVPESAREVHKDHIGGAGWMWQCACDNTLFVPTAELKGVTSKEIAHE